MAEPGTSGKTVWAVLIPALTGTIAFWSTLSLNMPDFTRYGRSQREQAVGQTVALPSTMTSIAFARSLHSRLMRLFSTSVRVRAALPFRSPSVGVTSSHLNRLQAW